MRESVVDVLRFARAAGAEIELHGFVPYVDGPPWVRRFVAEHSADLVAFLIDERSRETSRVFAQFGVGGKQTETILGGQPWRAE